MTRQKRRGIATLEFVLLLPLLLGMAAGLFALGRAALRKESVATKARNDAWRKRPSASPGDILRFAHDPADSEVDSTATKAVPLRKVFGGETLRAESRNHVLGRTWTYLDVPFPVGSPDFRPHPDELAMIAGNVPLASAALGAAGTAFGLFLNPAVNPVMVAAALVGPAYNVVLKVGGITLRFVFTPLVFIARITVKVLEIAAWASFRWGLARKLRRVGNMLGVALDAFNNLYEASRGREGRWDRGMVGRLRNSIP